jgi:hypothetical protein
MNLILINEGLKVSTLLDDAIPKLYSIGDCAAYHRWYNLASFGCRRFGSGRVELQGTTACSFWKLLRCFTMDVDQIWMP